MASAATSLLHVRINRGAEVVWEGDAHSLSAKNAVGPFDILPMHASFLTYIEDTSITVETENHKKLFFSCKEGIVHILNNNAQIYVDI